MKKDKNLTEPLLVNFTLSTRRYWSSHQLKTDLGLTPAFRASSALNIPALSISMTIPMTFKGLGSFLPVHPSPVLDDQLDERFLSGLAQQLQPALHSNS